MVTPGGELSYHRYGVHETELFASLLLSERNGWRYVIDMFGGTGTGLGLFWLMRDPTVRVIFIDNGVSEVWLLGHLPSEFHARVLFLSLDIRTLTMGVLTESILRYWDDFSAKEVIWLHGSPDCKTLSNASRGKCRYRNEDGLAIHPMSHRADATFANAVKIAVTVLRFNPDCCVSFENPFTMAFQSLPFVKQLIHTKGWTLSTTSYCKCTDACEGAMPQKHTYVLTYNCGLNLNLPMCDSDCTWLLPGTNYHKVVLCRNSGMHSDQIVLDDPYDKGRIPHGLFRRIHEAHVDFIGKKRQREQRRCMLKAQKEGFDRETNRETNRTLENAVNTGYINICSPIAIDGHQIHLWSQAANMTGAADQNKEDDGDMLDEETSLNIESDDNPTLLQGLIDTEDDWVRLSEVGIDLPAAPARTEGSIIEEWALAYPSLIPAGLRYDLKYMLPFMLNFIDLITFDFQVYGKKKQVLFLYCLKSMSIRVVSVSRKSDLPAALEKIISDEQLHKRRYPVTISYDGCGGMEACVPVIRKYGIRSLPIPPRTPTANLAESVIRWFKEDVAAVLLGACVQSGPLCEYHVGFAMEYVCYANERFAKWRSGHWTDTSYKLNTGVEARLSKLLPFAAPGWVFIPEKLREERKEEKFNRAEPCVLLGYQHMMTRVYRVLTTKNIVLHTEDVHWCINLPIGMFPSYEQVMDEAKVTHDLLDLQLFPELDRPLEDTSSEIPNQQPDTVEPDGKEPRSRKIPGRPLPEEENKIIRVNEKRVFDKKGDLIIARYIYERIMMLDGMLVQDAFPKKILCPNKNGIMEYYKAADFRYDKNQKYIVLVDPIVHLCRASKPSDQAEYDSRDALRQAYEAVMAQHDLSWPEQLAGPNREAAIKSYELELESLQETVLKELFPGDPKYDRAAKYATPARMLLDIKRDGRTKSRLVAIGFLQNKRRVDGPEFNYSSDVVSVAPVRQLFLDPRDRTIATVDITTAFLQSDPFPPEQVRFLKFKDVLTGKWRYFEQYGPLYGECSAPVRFQRTLYTWLSEQGFVAGKNDPSVFYHRGRDIIVLVFVDDCGVSCNSKSDAEWFFALIGDRFKIKDPVYLEEGTQIDYLGITFTKKNGVKYASMERYIDTMVNKCDLKDAPIPRSKDGTIQPMRGPVVDFTPLTLKEVKVLQTVGGQLNWAAACTRIDIRYHVSRICQYLGSPCRGALEAAFHLVLYCRENRSLCLYQDGNVQRLEHYSDTDLAGNSEPNNKSRSQFGAVSLNGSAVIHYHSKVSSVHFHRIDRIGELSSAAAGKPQAAGGIPVCNPLISDQHADTSSAAVEIYGASVALNGVMHLQYILEEMGYEVAYPITLLVDNESAIAFSKGTARKSRLKHIDVRQAWVETLRDEKVVKVVHVSSKDNLADILTKLMAKDNFVRLRGMLMVEYILPEFQPAIPNIQVNDPENESCFDRSNQCRDAVLLRKTRKEKQPGASTEGTVKVLGGLLDTCKSV